MQLPYNETDDNQCAFFPAVSAMKLELCHQIASSLNGTNSPDNIIVGPKNINRRLMRSRWLPASNWSKKFFAHCFCQKEGRRIERQTASGKLPASLLVALKTEYPTEDIIQVLSTWSPPVAEALPTIRPFRLPPLPLGMLLRDELLRLKKRSFIAIRTRIQCLEIYYGDLLGSYTEIIAIAVFVALQTADNDGLLKLFVETPVPGFLDSENPLQYLAEQYGPHDAILVYEGYTLHAIIWRAQRVIHRHLGIASYRIDALREFYADIFAKMPEGCHLPNIVLISKEHTTHPLNNATTGEYRKKLLEQKIAEERKSRYVRHAVSSDATSDDIASEEERESSVPLAPAGDIYEETDFIDIEEEQFYTDLARAKCIRRHSLS